MLRLVALVLLCVVGSAQTGSAQQPAIQYAYDELGQLVAVVDQDGNTAVYVYDAVGNILSIERVDAASVPGRVAITAVVPLKGKVGTVVSILGKGFGAGAGQNAVSFNGASATVTSAEANRLVTTVPAAATSGLITVTTVTGAATSPRPFRIVGTLAVTPATVNLGVRATQQFVATDGGAGTSAVLWAVDGIVGGDPGVGTVSETGFYTAPPIIVATRTVTVSATSRDDPSAVASATVQLHPPLPTFLAAAPIGLQVTDPGPRMIVAPVVGVQRGPEGSGLTIVAAAIGVSPPVSEAFSGARPVSLSLEPLITSVVPNAAARGSANLTLTLAGSALAAATGVDFLLNNAPDAAITVVNLTAAADGAQATALISIGAVAALGPRVVRVRTPAGATTPVGTGGNVFTVQ